MEIENKTEDLNLEEEKDAPKDVPAADSEGVPDLVASDSEKNKVWKFWCHQCEEILDVDPRPRDDGSLECPECRENLVERIAEDDEFLIARLEEQKEEAEEKKSQEEPNARFPYIMRSVRNSENPNAPNSPFQFHFIRRDGSRPSNRSERPPSRNGPPSDRRSSQRRNPFRMLFSEIFSRDGQRRQGRRQPEAQENGNHMEHMAHQINRIFMGGMPGASPELNFNMIFQDVLGLGNMGSFGGQRLDPSDFGIGFDGFMDILSRLQREGGHSGPPPASKKVVDKLKEFEYSDELKESEESACAVCKDDFKKGDKLIQFPCPNKHLYHPECIHPWLKLHNSCPVCRHELVTDDEWYERMKQFRTNMNTDSGNGPSDNGNTQAPSGSGSSGII